MRNILDFNLIQARGDESRRKDARQFLYWFLPVGLLFEFLPLADLAALGTELVPEAGSSFSGMVVRNGEHSATEALPQCPGSVPGIPTVGRLGTH
jgi:hypothetical protein